MESVSRESYRAAVERLNAYASREKADAVVTTGDEVLAVARLLRGEPRLRRALADPSRPPAERVRLIRRLIEGKVGAPAVNAVTTLVNGRWSSPAELLNATERLGVDALLAAADRAGELAEIEDELFRFGQVVSGTPALAGALADVVAPARQRSELAHRLIEGKTKAVTVKLVDVALDGFGGRGFDGGLTRLVELAAERRERQVAYVTVAAPLSDEDEERLGAKLSELYGREVSVKQAVDPEVLGGASVLIGSDLYDGTVLRRLNDTRKALTQR